MKEFEKIEELAEITSKNFRTVEYDLAGVSVIVGIMVERIHELECRLTDIDGEEPTYTSIVH
jgi:hypothetical protein